MASAEAARVRMAAEGVEPPEGTEFAQVVPEGVEATVPLPRRGGRWWCTDLVGGLRSAMSYADAHTIAEFHANARFVRITTAGLIESRPHDLH